MASYTNNNDTMRRDKNLSMFGMDWNQEPVSTTDLESKEKLSPVLEAPVNKVGVLVSDKLGEFVNTLPALDALQLSYPGTEIVLLGQAWQKRFMEGRPGPIERVEVVPTYYENVHSLEPDQASELEVFIARMQAEKFDIVLQMKDGGNCSNLFVKQLKPQLSIGLLQFGAPPLDRWIPFIYHQQQVLRNLEVVSLLGAQPVSLDPKLVVCEEDKQESNKWLPNTDQPVAVIYPGSRDPRCQWPLEKFAALGDALAWEGMLVVVVGKKSEKRLAESLIEMMNNKAVNLCGKLNLSGLAGLFSRAQVTAANDSGLLQFANACGAASVGIYWCGNLLTTGPVTHSRHRTAISWQMNCSVCGLDSTRNDCGHKETFVAGVSKDEVIKSALEFVRVPAHSNGRTTLARHIEYPMILSSSLLESSRARSYDSPNKLRLQVKGNGSCMQLEDPGTEPVFPGGW